MFRFSSRLLVTTCLATAMLLPSCKGKQQRQTTRTTTTTTQTTVSVADQVRDGLELNDLPELVTQARNGQDLEDILNSSGVNNLDLNHDNYVDYLNVEEFRQGRDRGFRLYTNEDNQRFDVAEILVSSHQNSGDVIVQGNPNYYGGNARYYSSFPLGQILFWSWLMNVSRPRYYHQAYYRGYYPRSYRATSRISPSLYRSRMRSNTFSVRGKSYKPKTTAKAYKSTTTSRFGASKSSSSTKSLANTQGKSFHKTVKKRPTGSGSTSSSSFGSSSNRSSTKSLNSSSSSSSFGSSSKRSTSSGFGSSSTRRSSSGFGSSSSRRRSSSSRRRR